MANRSVWEEKGDGYCALENECMTDSTKAKSKAKWLNSILETIGNTPLTKLNRIPHEKALNLTNILLTDVKLEYFNAGGSIEDRVALRMIEVAEKNGLRKEHIVLAPACGNIAVGIALVCAVKGYKCIIVTPERSEEDVFNILRALNAQIVRVSGKNKDVPFSHHDYAKVLAKGIENSYFLDEDQTVNDAKSLSHYETTAAEIMSPFNGKIDMIVVPIRTGAAFAGISKYIRQHQHNTKVYGVCTSSAVFPSVPNMSSDDVLSLVDSSCGDGIEIVNSKESLPEAFLMTRRLIREEGLMIGPSSGAAIVAALKLGETLTEGSNVVVVAADGIRNYMSQFIDDEWLLKNKILHHIDKKTITPKESTRPVVMKNVLEAINNTPLVKLQKLPVDKGIKCNMC
ncbi:pyridoxal-phosphate dependent protein [Dictyocaulus viviparus]|uniref:Pyridoxal-phosphate dependent protein n=1 Tax=Dictyocaulus viviparus TaxID=29172 RepID=A0A0D8X9G3_DICVI|nr:pyridoxal-phosphate dependent protein [Dictyocaulus viviparus]